MKKLWIEFYNKRTVARLRQMMSESGKIHTGLKKAEMVEILALQETLRFNRYGK